MIPPDILDQFDVELISYSKGDLIFQEGQRPDYYYQIQSGEVKMNNFNESGKEFIQGIFQPNQSFGEPPLLAEVPYPAHAEAMTDVVVYRVLKKNFIQLLLTYPEVHLLFTKTFASRLFYKAIMAAELASQEPEHRILRILDYLKTHVHQLTEDISFEVPLTRQQIADLTGLRVETVIRATKNLEKKGELKIKNRKLYR